MRQEAIERAPDAARAGDRPMLDAALASRALWKELCESVGDLMFETDRVGRFTFLAPSHVLGHQAHDLIGHRAADLLDPVEASGPDPFVSSRALRMQTFWFRRGDGTACLMAISCRPTDGGGLRGIGIDVTESDDARSNASRMLLQSMLERIVSRMRDELLASRMVRTGLRELSDCLGAEGAAIVTAATGVPAEGGPGVAPIHAVGAGWDRLSRGLTISDDFILGLEAGTIAGSAAGRELLSCSNRTRLGPPSALLVWRDARAPGWREHDRELTSAVALALRDPIEQDRIQRDITDATRTDVLTGLLSRRCFAEELQRRLDRLDRDREPATLLSIDIDDFRLVNETHGSERGDEALCHVASVLRDTFRPTDLICRIAGDRFAAWLDGADMFAAAERADFLCRNGTTILIEGFPVRLGLSVGLASRPSRSLEEIESLFRRADDELTHAKRSGKGVWRASQMEIET